MKKTIYLLVALLLPFSPCESRENLVSSVARSVLNTDSIRLDSLDVVARLLVPNTSGFEKLSVRRKAAEKGQVAFSGITCSTPPVVARGTNITSSVVSVSSAYPRIDWAKRHEFTHRDVPEAFDGFRTVFISDLHYKSLFKEKGLESLVHLLNAQYANILLMGGDYQEGCQLVLELFAALARVKTPLGTYGVMGNNDYERYHDEIIREVKRYGICPFEYQFDTLGRNSEQVILTGVRNSFDLANNGVSPTLSLSPASFAILLVHTPDYVEDVSVANFDPMLAGHTHRGQVRIFGYAPIIPLHYDSWLLTGLKYNSAKIPIIVTNGTGTSNKNIRIGASAKIVITTLHRLWNE